MTAPKSRPAKVFVGLFGLDQHEAGAIAVSKMLSDAGHEVVYGGRFNTAVSVATSAIEEDVDVIGLSCHSWEYLRYIDELFAELRNHGCSIPVIVGGSVITANDEKVLRNKGVSRTFGPSSVASQIVATVEELARQHRS